MSVMLPRDDGVTLLRLPFHLNDVGNVERQFALRPVGTFRLVVSVGTATTGFFNNPTVWWGAAIAASSAALGTAHDDGTISTILRTGLTQRQSFRPRRIGRRTKPTTAA
jgi:hypothetical protein